MSTEFKTLKVEKKNKHILQITLNRPKFRNAINHEMMHDLFNLWTSLYRDHDELRSIILTGAENAFCAGADLKERSDLSLEDWRAQRAVLEQSMLAMLDCPIPIIAAVNGPAFGGGLELILASDFAYAATTATFSQSETKVGLIPGAIGSQNLPRTCGLKRAKELTFTASVFSAKEAYEWGIINKICDPGQLMEEVTRTANTIAENAPVAIKQVKKALNMSQHVDVKSGFAYEIEAYNRLLHTKDREEGIRAFNEKRKPNFIGK